MSRVYSFFSGVANTIPVIIRKIGTFVLFAFTLGMLFGYFFVANTNPLFLLIPIISMIVMWYDLDEGVLVFILLMGIALLFPNILPPIR